MSTDVKYYYVKIDKSVEEICEILKGKVGDLVFHQLSKNYTATIVLAEKLMDTWLASESLLHFQTFFKGENDIRIAYSKKYPHEYRSLELDHLLSFANPAQKVLDELKSIGKVFGTEKIRTEFTTKYNRLYKHVIVPAFSGLYSGHDNDEKTIAQFIRFFDEDFSFKADEDIIEEFPTVDDFTDFMSRSVRKKACPFNIIRDGDLIHLGVIPQFPWEISVYRLKGNVLHPYTDFSNWVNSEMSGFDISTIRVPAHSPKIIA